MGGQSGYWEHEPAGGMMLLTGPRLSTNRLLSVAEAMGSYRPPFLSAEVMKRSGRPSLLMSPILKPYVWRGSKNSGLGKRRQHGSRGSNEQIQRSMETGPARLTMGDEVMA